MKATCPRSQGGWTLVELMVGVTIGLLLLAGISQIYQATKKSYDVQSSLAEMQDVGRYAIDVLTQDIHMAGYWGLMDISRANSTGILTGEVPPSPDRCTGGGDRDWGRMITQRIFGMDGGDTSTTSTDPNLANYSCITDRLRGDILTLRYADPVAVPAGATFTNTRLFIRTSPFQGSVVDGNPAGNTQNFVTEPLFSDHALVAHSYYVSRSDTISCPGGQVTPATLARKFLNSRGEPYKETLVNGVDHLQFQYGVDPNPGTNGYVNRYRDATDPGPINWNNVMTVRIWVLVRATCPEAGYKNKNSYVMGNVAYKPNDNFRRALFTTTVSLRNCKENLVGSQYRTSCQ